MFSSAEKTTHTATAVKQEAQQQTFFRKAGEETFFGAKESSSFFGAPVQAKLSVSSPDDPQEKEADEVADRVMQMPDASPSPVLESDEKKLDKKEEDDIYPKIESPILNRVRCKEDQEISTKQNSYIHRLPQANEETGFNHAISTENRNGCVNCKHGRIISTGFIHRSGRGPPASNISFEQSLTSSKGAGDALQGDTRQFMETRFNADFSGVRIHTGSEARQMTSSIHAQAFAHGNDIYFNEGKYSPQTPGGGTLLAHELTHTIQQGANNRIASSPPSSKTMRKRLFTKTQPIAMTGEISGEIDFSAKTGGHQLSESAREYFEDYFKTDLSGIRIHSDREVASFCKEARISAFVRNNFIGITPSKYNPESEEGAMLLSDQVAESLKQNGIRPTVSESHAASEGFSLRDIIRNAIKENKESEKVPEQDSKQKVSDLKKPLSQKDKAGFKKDIKGGPKKDKKKKQKSNQGLKDADGKTIKSIKGNFNKSPSTPAQDPAFQRVVKKTKLRAKKQKAHEPAEKKAAEAQNSAEAVPKEAEGKAQNRKTSGMDEAAKEDKPFNAESFKADLLKKIESITPKTLEEATEFKENNKINDVKSAMDQKVSAEKQNSTGPVNDATTQPLEVIITDNKQPVKLPPTAAGPKPASVGARDAAPKKKLDGEISMDDQSQSLDDEMKANNVSEDQLVSSNEPSFTAALDQKKGAQKDAVKKPQEYRKEEVLSLKQAKTEAVGESAQSLAGMHNARGKNFNATVNQQKTAKHQDEKTREDVTKYIQEKYALAVKNVKTSLELADKDSNTIFDEGSEAARTGFENYVGERMSEYKKKRYSGFWGGLRWGKDKLFGMPDAVNAFYKDGRDLYLKEMDGVITKVADTVTLRLNEAKKAITDGKKAIDDYVEKLPKTLQDVGKEARDAISDKFDSLEQSVNDKRDELIDGLAKKYVDNVKKLDDRIGELKEANKGLIDKAIGFLKKVWQVIRDLTNLFTTILARLASIVGLILSNPSGFFSNLGKAFRTGFDNFKNKFLEYLEKGLMEWLATNLGIAGIELPEKFDPAAIFSLALQVMDITKEHIRERAINLLGERKVKLLEKGGGLIYRVYNEGIGVIWVMIKDKLSDFKELVWDAITSFIKKSIIEAALFFMLSLLNPIGAFVKVCMAIYDFLMMLVRFKDRIIELLDTILGAVMNIASGAVEKAASMIEKALAKSISVIIGFLAALLHLNNIFAKIRAIIFRIQKRVEQAIDWVIGKAYSLIGGLVEGALSLEDKATAIVEKGKAAVIGAGKKAAGAVMGWLGLKKEFIAKDGKKHELYFEGSGENAKIIIKSDPTPYTNFLNIYERELGTSASDIVDVNGIKKTKSAVIADARVIAGKIEKEKRKPLDDYKKEDEKANEKAKTEVINKLLDQLAKVSVSLFGNDRPKDSEINLPDGSNNNNFAKQTEAVNIYKTDKVIRNGSAPTSAKHKIFDIIDNRQKGNASYYVRGHLINNNLGGPGKWSNMTALSRPANHEHESSVESKIKAAFDAGAVVRYKVKAVSNQSVRIPSDANKVEFTKIVDINKDFNLLVQIITEEKNVPAALTCEAFTRKKVGNAWVDDKPIIAGVSVLNTVEHSYSSYELGDNNPGPVVDLNSRENQGELAGVIDYPGNKIVFAAKIMRFCQHKKAKTGVVFATYEGLANYKIITGNDSSQVAEFTGIEKTFIKNNLKGNKGVKLN